jgi:hypothetical protein
MSREECGQQATGRNGKLFAGRLDYGAAALSGLQVEAIGRLQGFHHSFERQERRGWGGSTPPPGTQLSDSLHERRVGGQVISRDADALPRGPLSGFLQQTLPCQCVPASGSDQSHGEDIRLQFVVPGERTPQQLLPRLAQPGAGDVPAGGLAQQQRKRRVFDDPIQGMPVRLDASPTSATTQFKPATKNTNARAYSASVGRTAFSPALQRIWF